MSHLEGVVAITNGLNHSLALKSDGTVWAWGYNAFGQLGDGTNKARTTPVQVAGLSGVVAVSSAMNDSLALKSDGTVWTWGYTTFGSLEETDIAIPVQVAGLSEVVAVSAGMSHWVAVKSDGTLWVWGNNDSGQLGNATTAVFSRRPVQVSDFSGGKAVSSGLMHSLVMKSDGTVWAWGRSSTGQIGDGSILFLSTPVQVGVVRGNTGG